MVSTSAIESFPDEILLEIFSFCSVEDLALSIQHVNKRWREVAQDPRLWKDLVFKPERGTDDEHIRSVVEQAPLLRRVVLSHEVDAPLLVDALCRGCQDLQKLQFSSSQKLATAILKKLRAQFPEVECLVLAVHQKYNLTYRLPRTLD
ncbi:uncharacterized protein [Periplaneta americana]|uniref:uncharacterized protein n=1 Tax=Periplaneta americana TaxID=6978 RepID=UPI0037E948B7